MRPSTTCRSPEPSSTCARNVATSIVSGPNTTCARRKRRPIRRQLRNCCLTCSGVASVATSKSFGWPPSSRSRTAPPTRYAWNPASRRRYSTRSAFGLMFRREMPCCSRGTTRMVTGCCGTGTDRGSSLACIGYSRRFLRPAPRRGIVPPGETAILRALFSGPQAARQPRGPGQRSRRSLRLVVQDTALSRREHEFEPRRERHFSAQRKNGAIEAKARPEC